MPTTGFPTLNHGGSAFHSPARPVLYMAVGPLAHKSLAELPRVARVLRVRISGPLGSFILTPAAAGSVSFEARLQRSLPESVGEPDLNKPFAPAPTWDASLRSLARHLRPLRDELALGFSDPVGLPVYVLIDLRQPACVDLALTAVRALRQETMPMDITGICLTGRTAVRLDDEEAWQDQWTRILDTAAEFLFHRIYLMDGKDARQSWLQTEQHHARMAAEFLFHHGLSPYARTLRNHEPARVAAGEPLQSVCGSFICRTLRNDPTLVEDGVAETLAQVVFSRDREPLSAKEAAAVEKAVQSFGATVLTIYQPVSGHALLEAKQAKAGAEHRRQLVCEALSASLQKVAGKKPRAQLYCYFQALLPVLHDLLKQSRIVDRLDMRLKASEVLDTIQPKQQVSISTEELPVPFSRFLFPLAFLIFGTGSCIGGLIGLILEPNVLLYGLLFCGGVGMSVAAYWLWPKAELRKKQIMRSIPPDWDDILANPSLGMEMEAALAPLIVWCTGYSRADAPPSVPLDWPEPQYTGTVLDAVLPEWRQTLAEKCRESLPPSTAGDVQTRPEDWAVALLAEFNRPSAMPHAMETAFARHIVQQWFPKTWADVLALLKPAPHWPGRFFETTLAPLWAQGTADCDVNTGIVAVERQLWSSLGLSPPPNPAYRLVFVDWPESGTVVFVRLVQGMPALNLVSGDGEHS